MVSADVPCAPLNDVADVYRDPQVVHNETLVEYDAPWIGRVRHPRPAIKFSATPQANVGRHAPKLDEHTDEVLAELGFTPDEVRAMRTSGASGVKRPAH